MDCISGNDLGAALETTSRFKVNASAQQIEMKVMQAQEIEYYNEQTHDDAS
jgi:hypothetical protein